MGSVAPILVLRYFSGFRGKLTEHSSPNQPGLAVLSGAETRQQGPADGYLSQRHLEEYPRSAHDLTGTIRLYR